MPALSTRILNRTLLQRQLLAARATRPVLESIRHLIALQAQEPNWPYVGLWTRLDGFRREELTSLLADRMVVRGTVMRGTQHLIVGDDYRWLRPLIQPMLDRVPRTGHFGRENAGIDLDELGAAGRQLLANATLSRAELAERLADRFPGHTGSVLAGSVEFLLGLVHPPPNGTWGAWGNRPSTPLTLAETWLRGPMVDLPDVTRMIRRYLAAFGPATVKDVQAWSGLTRLAEVIEGMRPQLRVYRSEHGAELFDGPEGTLADPELLAPVRLLPAFDNAVLGHADRTRVISDVARKQVMPGSAAVRPTFLIDGFVAGTWSWHAPKLTLTPFERLSETNCDALLGEAQQLVDFIGDPRGTCELAGGDECTRKGLSDCTARSGSP